MSTKPSVDKEGEWLEFSDTMDGNINWCCHFGKLPLWTHPYHLVYIYQRNVHAQKNFCRMFKAALFV